MSQNLSSAIAVIGIDIGKNSFHVVGLDERGAIVLRSLALSFKPRWIEDLALV
jgi:Tfp pilus assembly PilM family ATPase